MSVSVMIDVPDLAAGIGFYVGCFGWRETARPLPSLAMFDAGGTTVGIFEKPAGSAPAPGADAVRDYGRHWTPVHLDIHVEDFDAALARAEAAGGVREALHRIEGRPPIAFMADPFGHGFCLQGRRPA